MNKVIRTGCISNLAEEISRLEKKEKDTRAAIDKLLEEETKIEKEINSLHHALDKIIDYTEDDL